MGGACGVSLETTNARASANLAEGKWRGHKTACTRCVTAYRRRKPRQMCEPGLALYADWKQARAELAEQVELDKLPIDGQAALW